MPGNEELLIQWLSKISAESAPVLTDAHIHVHEGDGFEAGCIFSGIADGAQVSLLFIPAPDGDQMAHFVYAAATGGLAVMHFYENPTVVVSGTALGVHNLQRRSTNESQWLAFSNPTISDVGEMLKCHLSPGSTGANPAAGKMGDRVRHDTERVLDFDSPYLIVIQNWAGATIPIEVHADWYETDLYSLVGPPPPLLP